MALIVVVVVVATGGRICHGVEHKELHVGMVWWYGMVVPVRAKAELWYRRWISQPSSGPALQATNDNNNDDRAAPRFWRHKKSSREHRAIF